MVLVIGLGGAIGSLDMIAQLDRRQAQLRDPDDRPPAERALAQAVAVAGLRPGSILRRGPEDGDGVAAFARLVDSLQRGEGVRGEATGFVAATAAGALALLLTSDSADRPALARIGRAAEGAAARPDLIDIGEGGPAEWHDALAAGAGAGEERDPDRVPVAIVAALHALAAEDGSASGRMPGLCGLAQVVLAVFDRRIPDTRAWARHPGFGTIASIVAQAESLDLPMFSRLWIAPGGGRPRRGLALLPGRIGIEVCEVVARRPEWRTDRQVSPHVVTLGACDAAALGTRLEAAALVDPQAGPQDDGPPGEAAAAATDVCRAHLLAGEAGERRKHAKTLGAKLVAAQSLMDFTDPASGSGFVTTRFGTAPVAFVFPGFGSAYLGMAERLCDGVPALADYLETTFGQALRRLLPVNTLYPPRRADPRPNQGLDGPPEAIAAGEFLGHVIYAWLAREWLGLQPSAAIGISLGGLAMAPALARSPADLARVLLDPGGMIDAAARLITGHDPPGDGEAATDAWAHYWVGGRSETVIEALRACPSLFALVRCDDNRILVGGPAGVAKSFLRQHHFVGQASASGMRHLHTPLIGGVVAAMYDELRAVAKDLPRDHLRGIDFYVSDRPVRAGASALGLETFYRQIGQSLTSVVDIPAIARAAYRRGVRVFIGCGPRDNTITWIRRSLEGRPHVAVALAPAHLDPWRGLLSAAHLLRAHGILPPATPFERAMRLAG